jgi:hypothetical protein
MGRSKGNPSTIFGIQTWALGLNSGGNKTGEKGCRIAKSWSQWGLAGHHLSSGSVRGSGKLHRCHHLRGAIWSLWDASSCSRVQPPPHRALSSLGWGNPSFKTLPILSLGAVSTLVIRCYSSVLSFLEKVTVRWLQSEWLRAKTETKWK